MNHKSIKTMIIAFALASSINSLTFLPEMKAVGVAAAPFLAGAAYTALVYENTDIHPSGTEEYLMTFCDH